MMHKTNRRRLSVAASAIGLAILAAVAQPAFAIDGFALTENGRPAATIVIARNPSRAAEFAAQELRLHVQKISGATLPIADDGAQVRGRRVLIGESAATRKLGLKSSDFGPREYLVRSNSDTLILIGRDHRAGDQLPQDEPSRVPGKWGGGLGFDGRNDVLPVVDVGFSDQAGSLEAWLCLPQELPAETSHPFRLLNSAAVKDPTSSRLIVVEPKGRRMIQLASAGVNSEQVVIQSGDLEPGWHHMLATWSADTGKIELIIDGKHCATGKYNKTSLAGRTLFIGGGGTAYDVMCLPGAIWRPFRGSMDDIRLSTVVRTVKESGFTGPCKADRHTSLLLACDEKTGALRDSSRRNIRMSWPGLFEARGSLDAVYHLLERYCGVRWYAAGETGLVAPALKSLSVPGVDVRRRPAMDHVYIQPVRQFFATPEDGVSSVDMAHWTLRMRLGGLPWVACHSYGGYIDEFLKTRPELLAQNSTGFGAYSGRPGQPCFSSPDFLDVAVSDARRYFDGKGLTRAATVGFGDCYSLCPEDMQPYCKCPACSRQIEEARDTLDRRTASNYIWEFVNNAAKEVAKTHPGKYISTLAYYDYAERPTKVELQPNIAVGISFYMRNWWGGFWKERDTRVYNSWVQAKDGRPLYVWAYYIANYPWPRSKPQYFFPPFYADTIVRQMSMYQRDGIKGIFVEHSCQFGMSSLLDQLELYLTFRLADDPSLDGQKLIDEFFTGYYGTAAGPMRQLYREMEQVYSDPASYPEAVRTKMTPVGLDADIAWGHLCTPERMDRWGALMDEARKAAAGVERKRVEMFDEGVWKPLLRNYRTYNASGEAKGS